MRAATRISASPWVCSFCGAPTDFASSGGAVRVPCAQIPPDTYATATVPDGVLSFCWPCRERTTAGRALVALHTQDAA